MPPLPTPQSTRTHSPIDLDPAITQIRRSIHARPELCFEEFSTSDLVAEKLTQWGIPIHRGLGRTGVVGIIQGKTNVSNKAIGLRADMDALPMQELNTFAHASQNPGKMHACGHDGHVAMLLGAAQILARERNFDGTVYVIFQPAEEGGGGAREMLHDGLFTQFPMQAIFGMHNWPGIKAGSFAVSAGPVMASSNEFKIIINGKGSHAALPHQSIDPIPIAAAIVTGFQTIISRNRKPIDSGVISVTMIHAGSATNVIADQCELQGTVRTFSLDVLDMIEQRMGLLATHTAKAYGAECEFEFFRNYPPTINSPAEAQFCQSVMQELFGEANVIAQEPTMGAEDFAYMLQEKPGAYVFIGNGEGDHREIGHGAGPCMLHNPSYDFNDDITLLGVRYWVRLAEKWLSPP